MQVLIETLALDILHREIWSHASRSALKHGDDVRVMQRRSEPHFALEAVAFARRCERSAQQHLQYYNAPQRVLQRFVNDALSAAV